MREGRDVLAVGADRVGALAVQPQGDEAAVGRVGRNRSRGDLPVRGRCSRARLFFCRYADDNPRYTAMPAWGSGGGSGVMVVNMPLIILSRFRNCNSERRVAVMSAEHYTRACAYGAHLLGDVDYTVTQSTLTDALIIRSNE